MDAIRQGADWESHDGPIVDVGDKHDPEKLQFSGRYAAEKTYSERKTPLSPAGLLWDLYADQILEQTCKIEFESHRKLIRDKIYEVG